jgi:DNA polymerase III epsilon subunit-like protein
VTSFAARRAALRRPTPETASASADAHELVESFRRHPAPAGAADAAAESGGMGVPSAPAVGAPAPAALPALDLGRPLRGCPVAVIDVETTGIDPREARIVEVAVVVCTLGESDPIVALSTRVRPGIPIPPDATKVHGIGDADVADAPTWAELWPRIADLTAPMVPAAFNSAYDAQVVAAECARAGVEPDRLAWGRWLDPFVLARLVDKFARGKRLADVAARRGIAVDAHGAAGDAMTTALLLPRLIGEAARAVDRYSRPVVGRPSASDLVTVGSYLAWQRAAALGQERDLVAFRQGEPTECPWHELEGVEPPAQKPRTAGKAGACATCGEPIGWAVRRGGERVAVEPGTTEPHRCRVRCIAVPIGPAVVIETDEGVVVRGYEPPADYQPGIGEVIRVGRRVLKPEALLEREREADHG